MMFTRTLIVSAVFFLIAVIAAVWLYPQLPAQVPTHWDLQGHVNGSMPRLWGAAFPALTILALGILTPLLPRISPRQFAITPFAHVYGIVMLAIQGAMLVIGLSALLSDAGYALPMPIIAMLSVGVLLMVLGNYMGKLRKNFFIGIRTPWTLASDAVWERTHRLGGRLFMLAGLLMVVGVLVGAPAWLTPIAIAAAALIPCVYSFWIYRRLGRSV
jgi:uncharacterized membrane protein